MKTLDVLKLSALALVLGAGTLVLPGCVVDGDDDDAEIEVSETSDGVKIEADD